MAEQLGDKEWISAGVIGELPHEPGWRVWLAERCQGTLYFLASKRPQHDRAGVAPADELIELRLDCLRRESLVGLATDPVQQMVKPPFVCVRRAALALAARCDDHDREPPDLLCQLLRQLQRRLVGPLHVVNEDRQRHEPAAAREEIPHVREQESLPK